MSMTLSSIAIAASDQMYAGLEGIVKKAVAAAKAKGIDDEVFLNWRIAPDMFPLARQIRIATELPVRGLSRIAGAEMPSFADDEATFEDFLGRIEKAKKLVHGLDASAIDAEPDAPVTFPAGGGNEMTLPRRAYLQNFILPNLYFHVTATYLILRHLGVDVGKRDYLAVPG
ncbi:MAG: DUF1993 domain-containing protein [Pseudomonadota bacterium]